MTTRSVGEWQQVVAGLAAARAAALTGSSRDAPAVEAALAAVDVPGSPAWAADQAILDGLRSRGLRWEGLTFTVTGVRATSGDRRGAGAAGTTTVTAQVATSAYREVDERTGRATVVPAQPASPVRLVLEPVDAGWRVVSATGL